MEKRKFVEAISKKLDIDRDKAELAVNAVVTELASPYVFVQPGEEVGFINDNHCRNNCKRPSISEEINPI